MSAPPPPDDTLSDDGLERLFASLEPRLGHRRRRLRRAGFDGPHASPGPLARDRRASARPRRHGRSRPAAGSGRRGCLRGARGRRPRPAPSHPRLDGDKPSAGIQEAAREARYRLLVGHAREEGASHLVTAHTLDDQAETVLMRLSRGSGLAGPRRHAPETDRQGIRHVRPLLDWPKARLLDLCRAQGWPFVVDPSNANERLCPGPLAQAHAAPGRGGADGRAPRTARGAGRPGRRGPRLKAQRGAGARPSRLSPREACRSRAASLPRSPSRSPCGCWNRPSARPASIWKTAACTGSNPAPGGCARPSGPGRRCASPSPGRSCGSTGRAGRPSAPEPPRRRGR